MSAEFVGVHTLFHYQYFQMVGILIYHFGRNMKNLNPFTKPCVPKTEVEEVKINEEVQKDVRIRKIEEEKVNGQTLLSKYANKRNISDSVTRMLVSGKSNNMCNIFEDNEEEDENELTKYEDKDNDNRKGEIEKDEKSKKHLIQKI